MTKQKPRLFKHLLDYALVTFGAALMAAAINMFLEPNRIVSGGVTGLSMTINFLFPQLPIGTLVLLINIPLFLLSWKFVGSRFLLSTIYGTTIFSILIDLSAPFLPAIDIEPLLAAVFGGAFMGVGMGIVFLRGATTGGSDVAARLLKLLLPHIQMGQLILLIDAVIVTLAGIILGSINSAFYAAITIYVDSVVLDKILYGTNYARVAYIISEQHVQIAQEIVEKLRRGVTFLNGQGAYSNKDKKVMLCVIKRHQIASLKSLVKEIDPNAFVILSEANEVLGEGFGVYDKNAM